MTFNLYILHVYHVTYVKEIISHVPVSEIPGPMTLQFSHNGANGPESKTTRMFRPVRQVAAPGAKSAVSDSILLSSSGICYHEKSDFRAFKCLKSMY